MEAQNKIRELTIFCFEFLGSLYWFGSSNLNCTNLDVPILLFPIALNMPLQNVYKLHLELPGQICKLKDILFCQFEQLHLVWNFRKCLLPFNVFHFALIKFSNFYKGCYDAMQSKSENLAQILGYQNWAVTNNMLFLLLLLLMCSC